jgi:hypothetical protein
VEKKSANIIKVYYIDSCELQNFHSEIISGFFFTRAIFRAIFVVGDTFLYALQLPSFDFFIVFWSDTHYSISLCYTRNIVHLNSFCIKFESKHFLYLYNKYYNLLTYFIFKNMSIMTKQRCQLVIVIV